MKGKVTLPERKSLQTNSFFKDSRNKGKVYYGSMIMSFCNLLVTKNQVINFKKCTWNFDRMLNDLIYCQKIVLPCQKQTEQQICACI